MSTANFYTASVYAKAILMLDASKEELGRVTSEVITIADYDISSLSFEVFIKMPLSNLTKNLLKILFEQNKIFLLSQIAKILKKEFLAKNNITLVEVRSARELSPKVELELKTELQNYFKTSVIIEKSTNPKLIDGFTLFFNGKFADFSKREKIFKIKSCILK